MSRVEPVDPRVRLAIALWPDDAPRGSVTTFCLEHDLSRKTFYAIRNRAQKERSREDDWTSDSSRARFAVAKAIRDAKDPELVKRLRKHGLWRADFASIESWL